MTVFLIILSVSYIKRGHTKQEDILASVFRQSNAKAVQSNINTYGKLDTTELTFEEMEAVCHMFAQKMELDDPWQVKKEQTDEIKRFQITRSSNDAKTTIKIESIKYPQQNTAETYMIVDIILYNYCDHIMPIKEKMEQAFQKANIDYTTNIVMTGTYEGSIEEEDKKQLAQTMMKKLQGKIHETYATEQVYSMAGYTKKIPTYIMSNQKKININLAVRYNAYENKTYLYLATPVITVEY